MEQKRRIIGILGAAGSGKSTLRQQLEGMGWQSLPFARPLKAMLEKLLVIQGASPREVLSALYGVDKDQPCQYLDGLTPRHAMQTLGTEWGRYQMGNSFWVNRWKEMLSCSFSSRIVVDDLRFENEAKAIRELGGTVVRVWRRERNTSIGAGADHVSETLGHYVEADFEIVNLEGRPEEMVQHLESLLDWPLITPAE